MTEGKPEAAGSQILDPAAALVVATPANTPIARLRRRLANQIHQLQGPFLGVSRAILPAALVIVAAFVLHWIAQLNDVFGQMGFDPDRSVLVGSLLIGAVAAAMSVMIANRLGLAIIAGSVGAAALFSGTFVSVTQFAVKSGPSVGVFDPEGWLITIGSLIVAALIAAWAGGALAMVARPAITDTVGLVRGSLDERHLHGRTARRLIAVALVAVILGSTGPIFSDLVNYSVDVHMLAGGPPPIGLGGPDLTLPPELADLEPSASPTNLASPTATVSRPVASASASASASTTPAASPTKFDPTPWRAWTPSGYPAVKSFILQPAPWTSFQDYAEVTVVTPPGYDPNGTRRYPVLYEAPYAFSHWDDATGISGALATLMDDGSMPPAIVVAMSTAGGYYTDSECADSFDGQEWFDTYVVKQVVPYIDAHYLTIPTADARATVGASQGGYCAPALASRHPLIFGSSISFSGYFHAGFLGAPSTLPFGTDQSFIDDASPDVLVRRMQPDERQSQYYVLIAQLSASPYGPEAARFARLLTALNVPHDLFNSETPHGWTQMRREFGRAMQAWGSRMVATGVFDTPAN